MRTHDPAQQSLPGIDSSPVTFLSPSALDKYLHCPRLYRVDTDRDGGLVVVDYKTGRRPVSQEAADADSALTIYAALAQRRLHRPVHGLVLDYVVAGTQVRTERPPEVLDERLDQVLETASR